MSEDVKQFTPLALSVLKNRSFYKRASEKEKESISNELLDIIAVIVLKKMGEEAVLSDRDLREKFLKFYHTSSSNRSFNDFRLDYLTAIYTAVNARSVKGTAGRGIVRKTKPYHRSRSSQWG